MHPKDPRKNHKHRERGKKKYFYTIEHLAKLFAVPETTIKGWIWRKKLDPTDIRKVLKLAVEKEVSLENQDPEE